MNKVVAIRIPKRSDSRSKSTKPVTRTAEEQVALAEKRLLAMEYRRDGMSYNDIALLLSTTKSTVFAWIQAELHDLRDLTREAAEDVRDMELQRLDIMLQSLMAGIRAGDPMSISTAIRIGERRSKLLGLDAAQKIDAKGAFMNLDPLEVAQMSDGDLNKMIQNLVMLAGAQRNTLPGGDDDQ